MDSVYSAWEAILYGVPQDSILGSFLFHVFICGVFLILKTTYFNGYVDENTPLVVRGNITDVIKALEKIGENLVS